MTIFKNRSLSRHALRFLLAIGVLLALQTPPVPAVNESACDKPQLPAKSEFPAPKGREGIRIGLVTDTHYNRAKYPERAAKVRDAINIFNRAGVDCVVALGDLYEGNFTGVDDYLADKALFEPAWRNAHAPVHWVLGNHDHWGVSNDQYIKDTPFIKIINYTFDLGDHWRFVIYSNVDGHCFSATSSTLAWLRTALEQAGRERKKVIIATHARVDQDYPGAPPAILKEPYAAFSYNADRQRAIIHNAVSQGVHISYVLQGHHHKSAKATSNGVTYVTFAALAGGAPAAVLDFSEDDQLIEY